MSGLVRFDNQCCSRAGLDCDAALASRPLHPGARHLAVSISPGPGGTDRADRLRHGTRRGGPRDSRRCMALFQTIGAIGMARGLLRAWAGRRGDHAGPDRRHRRSCPSGCSWAPGWSRPCYLDPRAPAHDRRDRCGVELRSRSTQAKPMAVSTYVPETFPHQWLPEKVELKTWEQIEPWYQQLLAIARSTRPRSSRSWLFDVGELNAAVGPGGGRAVRRDDLPDRRPRARGRPPGVRPRHRAEAQAAPERDPRPLPRLALPRGPARATATTSSTAPRRTAGPSTARRTSPARPSWPSSSSSTRRSIGAMTVDVPGPGADPRADGPVPGGDRPRRSARRPGSSSPNRRLADQRRARRPVRPDDRACGSRSRSEAGFANYVDYAYRPPRAVRLRRRRRRSSSTTRSSSVVVPLAREIQEERRERARGRDAPPLGPVGRPAGPAAAAAVRRRRAARRGDRGDLPRASIPSSARQFAFLREHGLLDLANRKGKAPGGYQTTLEDDRLPFIFMNAVGLDGDVRTLLHEGGHAFHALASRGEPLAAYRESPIEFCEVASMSHGAARRREPRARSTTRPTPTARIASCSRGSS